MTRRQFMASTAIAGAAVAVGCSSSRPSHWEFLSDDAAKTLAAVCDQIIPADDYASASQAGVVTYIDRQLTRHYRRNQKTYLRGLEQVEQISSALSGHAMAQASQPEQLRVVVELERQNRKFFELVRTHTLEGFYGSPRHGGNRDAVSWRMLGLDEPPSRGRAQYEFSKGTKS